MSTKYQPGVRVSEYLLERCLGAGTFGEVWLARHHVWEQERVAIKLPTEPQYVRFLQREGLVVHGLKHPNIVRVLGLDPYADTPYLVMELVNGPSLRDVLTQHGGGLPIPTAIIILRGMLRAMATAHAAGIIHRDLKPGNVLLNLDGRPLESLMVDDVKVADFGLGVGRVDALRSMIEQSVSIERDQQGATLAGTLAYMAPEIRDGEQPPSARSDLYAIGVILFQMLTGDRPAGTELPSAIRGDVPIGLDEVFRRLYARYDKRYENAEGVLHDLELRLTPAGRPGAPRPPPPPTDVRRPCPGCHQVAEPEDQYCTHCGAQLVRDVRRCPACGGYPAPRDKYCIFCGAALVASGE